MKTFITNVDQDTGQNIYTLYYNRYLSTQYCNTNSLDGKNDTQIPATKTNEVTTGQSDV